MSKFGGANALLKWCQSVTKGYPGVEVANFSKSWKDGLAFCAVIHKFRPDLIPWNELKASDPEKNISLAFHVAEKVLDITQYLEVDDLKLSSPEPKTIQMQLYEYYKYFSAMEKVEKEVAKEEPQQRTNSPMTTTTTTPTGTTVTVSRTPNYTPQQGGASKVTFMLKSATLKRLGEQKEAGLISVEEYNKQRGALIEEIPELANVVFATQPPPTKVTTPTTAKVTTPTTSSPTTTGTTVKRIGNFTPSTPTPAPTPVVTTPSYTSVSKPTPAPVVTTPSYTTTSKPSVVRSATVIQSTQPTTTTPVKSSGDAIQDILEKKIVELQKAKEQLEKDLADSKKTLDSEQKNVKTLKDEKEKFAKEKKDLLDQHAKQIKDKDASIQKLTDEKKQFDLQKKTSGDQQDTKIRALTDEKNKLQDKTNQLEKSVQTHLDTISKLKLEQEKSKDNVKQLTDERQKLQKTIDEINKSYESNNKNSTQWEQDNRNLKMEVSKLEVKIGQLSTEKEGNRKEVESAKKDLEAKVLLLTTAQTNLQKAQTEKQNIEKELDAAKKKSSENETKLREAQSENEKIQKQLKESKNSGEKEWQSLKDELANLKKAKTDLETEVKKAKDSAKEEEKKAQNLQKQVDQEKVNVDQLQKKHKKELDDLQQKLKKQETDFDSKFQQQKKELDEEKKKNLEKLEIRKREDTIKPSSVTTPTKTTPSKTVVSPSSPTPSTPVLSSKQLEVLFQESNEKFVIDHAILMSQHIYVSGTSTVQAKENRQSRMLHSKFAKFSLFNMFNNYTTTFVPSSLKVLYMALREWPKATKTQRFANNVCKALDFVVENSASNVTVQCYWINTLYRLLHLMRLAPPSKDEFEFRIDGNVLEAVFNTVMSQKLELRLDSDAESTPILEDFETHAFYRGHVDVQNANWQKEFARKICEIVKKSYRNLVMSLCKQIGNLISPAVFGNKYSQKNNQDDRGAMPTILDLLESTMISLKQNHIHDRLVKHFFEQIARFMDTCIFNAALIQDNYGRGGEQLRSTQDQGIQMKMSVSFLEQFFFENQMMEGEHVQGIFSLSLEAAQVCILKQPSLASDNEIDREMRELVCPRINVDQIQYLLLGKPNAKHLNSLFAVHSVDFMTYTDPSNNTLVEGKPLFEFGQDGITDISSSAFTAYPMPAIYGNVKDNDTFGSMSRKRALHFLADTKRRF